MRSQLVLVSALFGATLPAVQYSLGFLGSFTFMAVRFTTGAVILVVLFAPRIIRMTRQQFASGILIGFFASAAWGLQTAGLRYSSVSKVGFLTALYVPFVTLITIVLFRQWTSRRARCGVISSTAGLMLLSLGPDLDLHIGPGEILTLACAVATAGHIVAIARFAPAADADALAAVQVLTAAVLSFALALSFKEPFAAPPLSAWATAILMGILATALGFVLMNRAQQHVNATTATLLYALEPVWSGLTGYLIGDRLNALNWLGCVAILLGVVLSQPKFTPRTLIGALSHHPRSPTTKTHHKITTTQHQDQPESR